MRPLLYLLIALLPACSSAEQVSNSGFGAFEADIEVLDANTVAIAWYDTRHPNAEIYLRLLDPQLSPASPEFRLTRNERDSYEVDIAVLGEHIAATWYEIDGAGHSVVKLGLWDRHGRNLWLRSLSTNHVDARIPVITSTEGRLFVAWVESPVDETPTPKTAKIVAMWLDASGTPQAPALAIAPASTSTWNLNIELASTGRQPSLLLAYDSEHETLASELYLARISGQQVLVNRLSEDDGCASKYPDIAVRQQQVALTWFDQRFGNNEVHSSVRSIEALLSPDIGDSFEALARRISHSAGDSIGAYISWNGDSLGLAWSDVDDGEKQHNIYFQRLDATGKPLSEIRRLNKSQADSLIPSIARYQSGFVLGWNEVSVAAHNIDARQSRSEIAVVRVH